MARTFEQRGDWPGARLVIAIVAEEDARHPAPGAAMRRKRLTHNPARGRLARGSGDARNEAVALPQLGADVQFLRSGEGNGFGVVRGPDPFATRNVLVPVETIKPVVRHKRGPRAVGRQ